MKWMRFRIRTITDAEDILVSFMEDIGLHGAQIEDNVPLTAAEKEQMFVDILPRGAIDDGTAVLHFFLEETEDGKVLVDGAPAAPEEVRARILDKLGQIRAFADIGEGTVTMDETEDIDWINNWKQFFHQFWVDDILVIPSWEEPEPCVENGREKQPRLTFHIDPGTAFGTGMHETTQLCIRALQKYIGPETVLLDVGTGSGILALLALRLGIRGAVGTDLDPCALPAVRENMAANGIDPARFNVFLGNLVDDPAVQGRVREACRRQRGSADGAGPRPREGADMAGADACEGAKERALPGNASGGTVDPGLFDIVVANILPDVLIPLTPQAVRLLKPGGVYITSGILSERAKSVEDAMRRAGLVSIEATEQGEWRCVTGRLPENKEQSSEALVRVP